MTTFKYLFGPVHSRRFGRSLGVDLVEYKTCSLDCVFCQIGKTTSFSTDPAEHVPIAEVEAELARWFAEGGDSDFITLSGSGEPTLHEQIGRLIDFIHANSSIPVLVLTNGTTLSNPEVRKRLIKADVVKASYSAWDDQSFMAINRPAPGLTFAAFREGQLAFSREFSGRLWSEVFIVPGINDAPADVRKIAAEVAAVGPERIHLNTAVRPPAEAFVKPLEPGVMDELALLFKPAAETIGTASAAPSQSAANSDTVLAMLQRRPCTAEQICDVFGMSRSEVAKLLGVLTEAGKVEQHHTPSGIHYSGSA